MLEQVFPLTSRDFRALSSGRARKEKKKTNRSSHFSFAHQGLQRLDDQRDVEFLLAVSVNPKCYDVCCCIRKEQLMGVFQLQVL